MPVFEHNGTAEAPLRQSSAPRHLGSRWMPTVKQVVRRSVTPLVRAYLRWTPSVQSKQWFWSKIAFPYFACHRYQSYRFVASTRFGARIAGNTHEAHQQHIYFFGVWEPTLTRWISERLRPGDT